MIVLRLFDILLQTISEPQQEKGFNKSCDLIYSRKWLKQRCTVLINSTSTGLLQMELQHRWSYNF